MAKKPKSGISREDTDATKTMQLLSRISRRKQEEETHSHRQPNSLGQAAFSPTKSCRS
jgi:hypothetical protein